MSSPFPSDWVIIGSLCYVVRENRVLLLKRARPPYVGLWSPPGGKMQIGESPQECVIREIREETGLTIEQPELRAIMSVVDIALPVHWLLFVFRANHVEGDVLPCEEGELRWIDLNDINNYPRPASDAQIFPHVMDNTPILQLKFVYNTPEKQLECIQYRT